MNNQASHHFLTRADVTRLAGVKRPAINNWEKRHADFPTPVVVDGEDRFVASDVAAWLARRRIPSDARADDEPAGTTYGDRFMRNLGGVAAAATGMPDERLVRQAVERILERFRGHDPHDVRLYVCALVYLRGRDAERWRSLAEAARDEARHATLAADFVEGLRGGAAVRRPSRPGLGEDLAFAVGILATLEPADMAICFELLIEQITELVGRSGGEYFTPRGIARLACALVRLRPSQSVYDPFCRSGEFLVDAVRHREPSDAVEVFGDSPDELSRELARMNVALHGAEADLRDWRARPGRTYDRVLTNPPFNMREAAAMPWTSAGRYGRPPERNQNYGWLQHAISSLNPGGKAAVLMPNHAAVAAGPEQAIRSAMVEDGAVECVIALPPYLFAQTAISVMLWILRYPAGRPIDVLFVDATWTGAMASRTVRVLRDTDVNWIAGAYYLRGAYDGTAGFTRAVPIDEIRAEDYSLNPLVYAAPPPEDRPSAAEARRRVSRLRGALAALNSDAAHIDERVDRLIGRIAP